jgi:hypothetical protein
MYFFFWEKLYGGKRFDLKHSQYNIFLNFLTLFNMKKFILAPLLFLSYFTLLTAQTPTPTPKSQELNKQIYHVWVDGPIKQRRYLWDVTDSTITLGTNARRPEIGQQVYRVEAIKWIKFRHVHAISRGILLGGGIALTTGILAGIAQGNDTPQPESICVFCKAEDKAKLNALLLTPVGMVIGGAVGGRKIKVSIDGSRAILAQRNKDFVKYLRYK